MEYAKRALLGFDAYVDEIYRPVRERTEKGPVPYAAMAEFGQRVAGAAGKSIDMDLIRGRVHMGGNAPLMADGMAALGVPVHLICGAGKPEYDPAFRELAGRVRLDAIGNPCRSIALEFDDGKVLMGDPENGECVRLESIRDTLGEERLEAAVREAHLIASVNWSSCPGLPEIARHLAELSRRFPLLDGEERLFFFDLSDPSSVEEKHFSRILDCIRDIGADSPAVLGLNRNEFERVLAALGIGGVSGELADSVSESGPKLLEALRLRVLTVHSARVSFALSADGIWRADGAYTARPAFTTGAGDHYNAGFCWALLSGLPLSECVRAAYFAAAFYVRSGRSAEREELSALSVQDKWNKQRR